MTLPSSRRPAFVIQALEEESKQIKKIKLSRFSIFMDDMGRWFENLRKKEKESLTLKKFKNRALFILEKLNFEYDNLPLHWVTTLTERHNIRFYRKKAKPILPSVDLDAEVSITVDPLSVPHHPKKKMSLTQSLSGRTYRDEATVKKTDKDVTNSTPAIGSSKKKCKKLLDLTDKHPPVKWLKAYSEIKHPPRALTMHSTDDLNIMFYDYDPKYEDELGEKLKNGHRVHDCNSFRWWDDQYKARLAQGDASLGSNF